MTEHELTDYDSKFENWLDERSIESRGDEQGHGQFGLEQRLQEKIEQSLRRSFAFEAVDRKEPSQVISGKVDKGISGKRLARHFPMLATAASLLVMAAVAHYWVNRSGSPEVKFKPVPLAQLFNDSVNRGFKPYYDCSDRKRFADEFERRQGVPMKLLPLPSEHKMLGVSYLGGISRNTTAVLFEAEQKPIIVFVDVSTSDVERSESKRSSDSSLSIHQTIRNGLIFYEVSEFHEPRMTPFIRPID